MENKVSVLDHGFVVLRNLSGPTRRTGFYGYLADSDVTESFIGRDYDADDVDPANAARMSFNGLDSDVVTRRDGSTRPRTEEDDHKLAEYLIANWHTSPFEMIEVWIEMKLPIFVARQFVRHRTTSINEVSGRYITLPAEWYIPEIVGGKAPNAKQGQEYNLRQETQANFKSNLNKLCEQSYALYLQHLAEGVAPEHARMFLSLNHYTHWLWKQNLHNLMHFLSLRSHEHAQIEAQMYANAIIELLRQQLPKTMELFDKYRRL